MKEQVRFLSFHLDNDSLAAVEIRVRSNGEEFQIYDEAKGWVAINVSQIVKTDILKDSGSDHE